MRELDGYMQKVVMKILSFTNSNTSLVKDPVFFICLSYNRQTYQGVAQLIRSELGSHKK